MGKGKLHQKYGLVRYVVTLFTRHGQVDSASNRTKRRDVISLSKFVKATAAPALLMPKPPGLLLLKIGKATIEFPENVKPQWLASSNRPCTH